MPRTLLATLPFLAVAALAAGCSSSEERAERARDTAEQALQRGDLGAARGALAELREHGSRSADGLLELTGLMLRGAEAPQAVWLLEAGVVRFPERRELRLQLARAALVVANPALALSTLAAIPADAPEDLDAQLIRAQAELDLGDLEAALATLSAAAQRHPGDPRASLVRIATLLREKRFDAAAGAVAAAKREASRDDAAALEVLAAKVQAAQGDLDGAIARLRASVEPTPRNGLALQTLSQLLLGARRGDEAVALVRSARDAAPDEPALAALEAQVLLQSGELEAAEPALRAFVALSDSPSAHLLLAQFLEQLGQPERVVATLESALARFPDTAMLEMHLAETLIDLGRLEAARQHVDAFRAIAPADPHHAYLLARLQLGAGDAAGAVRRLTPLVSRLDRAYTQFWLGRALEESGDLPAAERRYGLALLRDAAHSAAAIALARLATARGDWPAAAHFASIWMRRAPAAPESYAAAVRALVRAGAADAAVAVARQYAARFRDRVDAHAALAFALRAAGEHGEAAAALDAAEARLGRQPELDGERALLAALSGGLAEGIAQLRSALARSPETASLHASLAVLLFGAGDAETGAAASERALALAPDELEPLEQRARFFASRGAFARARRDCERFLALQPRHAGVQFMLGAILSELGEADAAIAAYRRAIELDASAFAPRNNLALLLAARGELAEALEHAQESYARAETNAEVIDTLGWLYLENGLTSRAIALLEKARAADSELASPQLHLALAYREAGRGSEARALLQALSARLPGDSDLGVRARRALRELEE